MENNSRINSEWITLNAVRGMVKIAVKGDLAKSTYDNALELGGELYPALLGADASILKRERESEIAKEYRQRARLRSKIQGCEVPAVDLIHGDIGELEELLFRSKADKNEQGDVDALKRRLGFLVAAEKELNPVAHTENKLIFRDALAVERTVPVLGSGEGYRDFQLPDSNTLRVRVLHPDKPEHVTGADIIYERHNSSEEKVSIVVVQYKIWEDKTLLLTDSRMKKQIDRLKSFACAQGICNDGKTKQGYRFPCCAGFLRPTDKLQRPDQKFISSGEHLPICHIKDVSTKSVRGNPQLEYKKIRDISLSSEMFEQLFNTGKIGSRWLTYDELVKLYQDHSVANDESTVIIYAQEFCD